MATPEQEFQRGRNAIVYFNNVLVREFNYPYTVNETIKIIQSRQGAKNFVQGLGMGIIEAEVSEKNVQSGMELLARKGGGKIPSTNGAFTQAIANDVRDNISYVDASLYVTVESAKDIGTAVLDTTQNIGDAVIGMGKTMNFMIKYWWITIPVGVVGTVWAINYLLPMAAKIGKVAKDLK